MTQTRSCRLTVILCANDPPEARARHLTHRPPIDRPSPHAHTHHDTRARKHRHAHAHAHAHRSGRRAPGPRDLRRARPFSWQVFLDAARQISEAYGIEMIAERMRAVGDDHFAAGNFAAAAHAYAAGIEKHDADKGDSAQLMHCYVNRAAALLKLGEKELAVHDADEALKISQACYAPKTQRKAYLRRAQALFELGKLEAAASDAEQLGSGDDAAGKLLEKIAEARAKGEGTVV